MKRPLPDGTHIDVTGDDPDWGVDSESGRTARWEASTSLLLDSEGNVIREVAKARHGTNTEPRKAPAGRAGDASRFRFVTLNAFVDEVARYLDDTERSTWHVLYRHADAATSTAEVSISTIAEKTGRSERSVIRAIEHLTKCGLIERLHRGRRRTGPSRYRVATRPADQLQRVRELAEARNATRSPRVQRDTRVTLNGASRDHYGRFST